jgi:putative membrane protein
VSSGDQPYGAPGSPESYGSPGSPLAPEAVAEVRSPLSDGEWHRLHPLTPLMRGGLFLVIVIGIVISNLRDRLIAFFVPGDDWDYSGDPVDYIVANDLILLAALAVLGVLLVLLVLFWLSWRFHTFRITGDDVEVRSGVLFRTHRRAPLDRVQGVNLTRPMVARLLGMAKLEVVGAGLDSNVKLEYLSTSNAEAVRGDILRLASGRQLGDARANADAGTPRTRATAAVTAGITGLIDGAEGPVDEPASVVHIPPGRLIGSHLLSGSTIWLLLLAAAVVVGSIVGTQWILFSIIPTVIGFGAYWFRQITRTLRYSIAPTRAGVRITFGLFTTITETLPPGRIHAVEISQPLMWRGVGWWRIKVNRLSGRSATESAQQQFAEVLPVGTRADVERVMQLILPGLPDQAWPDVFERGILGPTSDDPYTTTPRRARWLRPLSWRRNGFLLTSDALLLRSGVLRRALVILPLARLQSLRISQGPVDRAMDVAGITGHTVLGQVSGTLGILDRAAAMAVWSAGAAGVIAATARDRSHRWSAQEQDSVAAAAPETAAMTAPETPAATAPMTAPGETGDRS